MIVQPKISAVKEPKSYGRLELNSKEFPAISDLKLGESVTLTITVEINSLRKPDSWEISHEKQDPNCIRAGFNILNVVFPKADKTKK